MKVRSKLLTSIILLLCMVFSSVLLAEHGSTGRSIISETSKDRHKHEKRDRRMDFWSKNSIQQKHFQENSIVNASSDAWKIEAVDAQKYFSDFYSRALAVDAHNYPHIAYGGDHLYYAYFNGNTWNYETPDATPDVGLHASIALDSSGKVHISYIDHAHYELKYATNASGKWIITTVDYGHYSTSIAIDSMDKVHISYGNHELRYATNASGEWVTTTVDRDGYDYNSIAIDSRDKVHIGYSRNNALKYATNVSGEWKTTIVDEDISITTKGRNISIAIDSKDKVHISYHSEMSTYELRYVTNTSGAWVTTTVDSNGNVGDYTSIAIDSNDKVHISYCDYTSPGRSGNLKYATNISGNWVTTIINYSGGFYTSIAIDSQDKVHISYFDNARKRLMYAANITGGWEMAFVDNYEYLNGNTSIATDSKNDVHINYCTEGITDYPYFNNAELKYTTNTSGQWSTTTVDSNSIV